MLPTFGRGARPCAPTGHGEVPGHVASCPGSAGPPARYGTLMQMIPRWWLGITIKASTSISAPIAGDPRTRHGAPCPCYGCTVVPGWLQLAAGNREPERVGSASSGPCRPWLGLRNGALQRRRVRYLRTTSSMASGCVIGLCRHAASMRGIAAPSSASLRSARNDTGRCAASGRSPRHPVRCWSASSGPSHGAPGGRGSG